MGIRKLFPFNKNNASECGSINGGANPRYAVSLEGGGASGAFTWGVLTSILDSSTFRNGEVDLVVVTGTSAGTMNGILLTYALNNTQLSVSDRCDLGIKSLKNMWGDIGTAHCFLTMLHKFNECSAGLWDLMLGISQDDEKEHRNLEVWPNVSQKDIDGFHTIASNGGLKGMEDLLNKYAPKWDRVTDGPVHFYTSSARKINKDGAFSYGNLEEVVHGPKDLKVEHAVASGALRMMGPQIIDGNHHFDGGYCSNPYMRAIDEYDITDCLVIRTQPEPKGRIKACLQEELFHRRALEDSDGEPSLIMGEASHEIRWMSKQRKYNVHTVSLPYEADWTHTICYNTDPKFLNMLFDIGVREGKNWVQKNGFDRTQTVAYESVMS